MFGSKAADPFDELLEAAQAITAERNRVLEATEAAESRLAEADENLLAARARVGGEEYAAAQIEGGLAIASKAAQQGVTEAELKARTARLKLQGLRTQLQKTEADLVPAWERLEAFRDDFILQTASELSEQADRAVESFRALICKAFAFRRHTCGDRGKKYGNRLAGMINTFTSNANNRMEGHRCSIRGGIFSGPDDGKKWALHEHWGRDPEALALSEAIQAIDDRISPIGAVVAAVRPKQ